jgi:hypothetical protein
MFWTPEKHYLNDPFEAESELESAIAEVSATKRTAVAGAVERVLAAKRADAAADVTAWERQIDERVYRLYGLTAAEIKIVEGKRKG